LFALAAGGIAATFLTLLMMLVPVLIAARRMARAFGTLRQRFVTDAGIQSLRQVAANAEAISKSARDEVSKLSRAVSHLTARLDQASDLLEERLDEFHALLQVVQGEAEEAFIEGAATARGVRAGLGSLGSERRAPRGGVPGKDRDRPFEGRPVDAHPDDPGLGDETPSGEETER
jgi:hypothetical protein